MFDDKFRALVSDCQFAFAIHGNPAQGRFELADIVPLSEEARADIAKRKDFIGAIGLSYRVPWAALTVALDATAMAALSVAFAASVIETSLNRAEESMHGANSPELYRRQDWKELT